MMENQKEKKPESELNTSTIQWFIGTAASVGAYNPGCKFCIWGLQIICKDSHIKVPRTRKFLGLSFRRL